MVLLVAEDTRRRCERGRAVAVAVAVAVSGCTWRVAATAVLQWWWPPGVGGGRHGWPGGW